MHVYAHVALAAELAGHRSQDLAPVTAGELAAD